VINNDALIKHGQKPFSVCEQETNYPMYSSVRVLEMFSSFVDGK
jgi:hypothetical protein